MHIQNVIENLKQTIDGKKNLLALVAGAADKSDAAKFSSEFIKLNIRELETILADIEKVANNT